MTESQRSSKSASPLRPVIFIIVIFATVMAVSALSRRWAPAERVAWRDDIDAAREHARVSGRPLLLYFTASWCGPCQVMRRQVWSDQDVADAMSAYVPVRIDIDRQPSIAAKYHVQAVPLLIVLDKQGQPARSRTGGMSAAQAIRWLRDETH